MIPVLIDCDPGQDDALALLLALASAELDVVGVTAVAGNQTLDKTTANALRVLELAGRADIPVAAGADGSAVTDHTDDTDPPADTGDDMPDGITADASAYADLPALLRAIVTRLVVNRYDSTVALLDAKVRYVPAVQDGVPMHENQGLLDRVIREVAEHQTTVIGTAAVTLSTPRGQRTVARTLGTGLLILAAAANGVVSLATRLVTATKPG